MLPILLRAGLRSFLTAALFLCLSASPVDAQPDSENLFGEEIEVRVVNLEVVVTDRSGQRISGLNADDFRLRVDGQVLPIDFFSEIADGHRVETVDTLGEPNPRGLNPTGVAPGEPVGLSYLVFIDRSSVTRNRKQVLEGIRQQVSLLGPEDRMAIVSYRGRKLQVLSPWSQSRAQLDTALARASGAAPSVADFEGEYTPDRALLEYDKKLERIADAVQASMRSFAQTPGRKVMLLLSGGWPMSICNYLTGPVTPTNRDGGCFERGPEIYRSIYEMANLLGYTLYPIDLANNSGFGIDASRSGRNPLGVNSFRDAELHATLQRLARETGGLPILNQKRRVSMEAVIEDTRSYYWLGFTPEWLGNNRRRNVQLEVLRPGLEVRYRENFKDLSRDQEMDFLVESALLVELPPGADRLAVQFGDVPQRGRKVKVPVEVTIPMDSITMLPHQGRYVAHLELRVAALDAYGGRNEIVAVPVQLEGDRPPPEGSHAVYAMDLRIRRQPQDLLISLYDPVGDRMMVAKGPFKP